MKKNLLRATAFTLLTIGGSLKADLNEWAQEAASPDQSIAEPALAHLRETGPEGLLELERDFATEIQAHRNGDPSDKRWERIAEALDQVSGQHDDYASGLYWYTDLEKAKAAANVSGKLILSLRLLGRLDEDLSCANSRFFRTTLYPNAQVNHLLKDKFILHWESVRPVPIVTIDFGDGRKLVRTITGNSVHYILDSSGRIIDALPGLYNAPTFASELMATTNAMAQRQQDSSYMSYQEATRQRLLAAWKYDLARTLQGKVDLDGATEGALEMMTDDSRWKLIGQEHLGEISFDAASRELISRKFPLAETAAPLAVSKMLVETPMLKALRNLQSTVSLDTVRNNYLLRTKILAFLETPPAAQLSLGDVNDWVYSQIFLTPKNDPWLGLAPADVYSGIAENGQIP